MLYAARAKATCADDFPSKLCRRHAALLTMAGPFLVSNQPRAPRGYVIAGFQGSGVSLW